MTRDDLKAFHELDIDFSAIGLDWGGEFVRYFCTPEDAEEVGSIGCDGVHFVLLPGDEAVYCVDPSMGEEGTYVLPVGRDFREFLSFVLYCKDANPLSQIYWLTEERFSEFAAEDAAARKDPESTDFFARKDAACAKVVEAFGITEAAPYQRIKELQAAFDPSILHFSDEYYDVLGIERE